MKKKLTAALLVAASLSVTSLGYAAAPMRAAPAPGYWYIGVGANYNAIQTDRRPYGSMTYKLSNHDWGFNIFGGQRFSRHFAHELGFQDIGEVTYKTVPTELLKTKIKDIYHVYYDGIFLMPITSWFEVFANGGVSYLSLENEGNLPIDSKSAQASPSQKSKLSTFGLNYGAGVQVTYQKFLARARYMRVVPCHDVDDVYGITDTVNLEVGYQIA